MRGPSDSRTMFGCLSSAARSASAKPPSGPISSASAGGCGRRLRHGQRQHGARRQPGAGKRLHRICHLGVLVAEHQQTVGLARGDGAAERHGLCDFRQTQDAALLRRLDRVGAHAREIDPLDLGVLRQHRQQPRSAHLDRLLHHVVEPFMLERGKQVVQVGRHGLRAGLLLQRQRGALAADRERRPPFTIAAVKRQHPVAGLETQHVAEIMRLRLAEGDLVARLERVLDVEAGAAEVVSGQRRRALCRRRREFGFTPSVAACQGSYCRFEVPTPLATNSIRNFKSKSGTHYRLPPFCPKFMSECAAAYHDLTGPRGGAVRPRAPYRKCLECHRSSEGDQGNDATSLARRPDPGVCLRSGRGQPVRGAGAIPAGTGPIDAIRPISARFRAIEPISAASWPVEAAGRPGRRFSPARRPERLRQLPRHSLGGGEGWRGNPGGRQTQGLP